MCMNKNKPQIWYTLRHDKVFYKIEQKDLKPWVYDDYPSFRSMAEPKNFPIDKDHIAFDDGGYYAYLSEHEANRRITNLGGYLLVTKVLVKAGTPVIYGYQGKSRVVRTKRMQLA